MNDPNPILLILVLLFLVGLFLVPLALFFVYVFYQTSKRKSIRSRVLSSNQQWVSGYRQVPVRYASEPRFKSFFKIFPWEGAGYIFLAPGQVSFIGELNSGLPVQLQFHPSQLQWLGKAPWPNGAVSWILAQNANGKHYFSSETGAFIIGSNRTTKAMLDEIGQYNTQYFPPAAG
jgi:hypothetical protein